MAATARAAARDRIERLCASDLDPLTLRVEILDVLRRVVGFDSYAWVLTDPATWVGVAPLADVPDIAGLPELIRLKYLTPVNRWTALGAPVGRLHATTGGDLAQSLLWRQVLSRHHVVDVASLVFADRFGCWAFLDLWRSNHARAFDADDAAFLGTVADPVTEALRRSLQPAFPARVTPVGARSEPVVLMLSPELAVRVQTPATEEYLRTLVPPAPAQPPVPAGAYNVAAQLLAVQAGVDTYPPWARVHLADGRWLTLRAANVGAPGATTGADIAVTVEDTTAPDRLELFARVFALSKRETELLARLAGGVDTRELADQLAVSEHTVQDHLKSIFAKTKTRSRPALLSAALGTGPG